MISSIFFLLIVKRLQATINRIDCGSFTLGHSNFGTYNGRGRCWLFALTAAVPL
jgi:hypothetical protein